METYPWPHWVIDDFLDREDYYTVLQEALDIFENIDIHMSPSPIERNHGIYIVREGVFNNLARKYEDLLRGMLDESLPIREYYDLSVKANLTYAAPGADYPIHYEVPSKILATNTYIWPQMGNGTKLYKSDKSYFAPVHAKTIDWEPNRSFCFIPQDDVTWHSYDNPFDETRIVLLIGLVDEKRQTKFY